MRFSLGLGPGRYVGFVATWDPDAETSRPLDYRLVHNSFVTMFWRVSLFEETLQWLGSQAYDLVEFDASSWASAADMFNDIAVGLDFPDHFGRNFDGLNDCMGDVASGDYGWDASATGLVVVLRAFDRFAAADRLAAQTLLDIFASQARSALLVGNRVICLVQSDDPQLSFEPVGAMPVLWNDAEWLRSKRKR